MSAGSAGLLLWGGAAVLDTDNEETVGSKRRRGRAKPTGAQREAESRRQAERRSGITVVVNSKNKRRRAWSGDSSMVETQARASADSAHFSRRSLSSARPKLEVLSPIGNAPRPRSSGAVAQTRLALQPIRQSAAPATLRNARSRTQVRRALKLRGEAAAVGTAIACFVSACTLGIIYLAAYATVAAQGREIHALQGSLATAQAQHQDLVQQLTSLSSANRVQELAKRQGMVLGAPSVYVSLSSVGNAASLPASQLAMAR